ncbi:MAG: DUF6377 domain-containing protein, partial [Tannerellaceae bacterium]|nr:DUF6377 domain-containing protein [Tannerellaceae bacterium]
YFFFIPLLPLSASEEIDNLLSELDRTLQSKDVYMRQKEQRLSRLKEQLNREVSHSKQFEICYDIIEEYKSYSFDSALVYIDRNLRVARKKINRECEIRTLFQYLFVLSSSGLFLESEAVINQIPREELPPELVVDYFKCVAKFHSNLGDYLSDTGFAGEHYRKVEQYTDSVYHYLPETSTEKIYYQAVMEEKNGNWLKAIELTRLYIRSLHPEAHEYAKMNFYLAGLYRRQGDIDLWARHVIKAAMADIPDASTENMALLTLASWLYQQNDIERAYFYIQSALDDANFYNARLRNFQISRTLPIINQAYQKHKDQQRRDLKWALIFTSTVFLLLLITVVYLKKQTEKLRRTRQALKSTNQHLEEVNEKLNNVNQELSESNLVKEEYIGHFMDPYSGYISKMEDYRKMIHTKIVAKRFDELLKMTASARGKDTDVKELYTNFDEAFLNIYPGFVEALNNLLKKEERFELRKGELLNTELRVFALIRLGITDSNKIADFLRCSLQAVYNYRSKIRKRAIKEDEDIEEQIRKIGSYKQ